MRSAICKPEIEIPYYQRGLRINDRNSENVLFANVSYDVDCLPRVEISLVSLDSGCTGSFTSDEDELGTLLSGDCMLETVLKKLR